MEKKHGEEGEIIDFTKKREEKEKIKVAEAKKAAWEAGRAKLESLAQEARKNFQDMGLVDVRNEEGVTVAIADMNPKGHAVHLDPDLIAQGWSVCGAVAINEETLKNKKELMDTIKWKKVVTRESTYKNDGKPVIVFYGKN